MLYERWRQVARQHSHETALCDLARGEQWTFDQLAMAAERGPEAEGPITCPQGISAEFIFTVLRAWRARQVTCPLEPGQLPPSFPSLPPPDIVHLKTTSASTGRARGIALTAEQLMADAENIVTTMGLRPGWPNLGVVSLAHSYGFSNLVLPLLLHGIPLFFPGSPLPESVRAAVARVGPVTVPAVPALWRAWSEADVVNSNVRLAISAGAPLPASVERSIFDGSGVKVHNFYGASECGGIAYDQTPEPRHDTTCVGSPMRHVQVKVADNGCLLVRSRAVAQSYWPEPSEELSNGGFRTSDLAEILEGQIHLRGRLSDQINVAGRKVAPESIEEVLLSHPAVRECLVFGAPSDDGDRTEIIVACVAAASEASREALKQFLSRRLPGWQVPREWWFVPALGPNNRGKLSRAEWRKQYLERRQ